METMKFTIRRQKPRAHRALFEDDQYRPRLESPKTRYQRRPKHRGRGFEEG